MRSGLSRQHGHVSVTPVFGGLLKGGVRRRSRGDHSCLPCRPTEERCNFERNSGMRSAGSREAARPPTVLSARGARSNGHEAVADRPYCLPEPGSGSSGAWVHAFQRSADSDAPHLLERSAGAANFSCSTPEDTGEREGRLTGRPQARTGARTVRDSMGAPSLAVNADMATGAGVRG